MGLFGVVEKATSFHAPPYSSVSDTIYMLDSAVIWLGTRSVMSNVVSTSGYPHPPDTMLIREHLQRQGTRTTSPQQGNARRAAYGSRRAPVMTLSSSNRITASLVMSSPA